MNEPKRLLEGGSSKARQLLLAGQREAHPESLVPSVMGALGLAATVTAFVPSWSAKLAGLLKHALSYKFLGAGVIAVAATGGYVAGRAHERALERRMASPRAETAAVVTPRPAEPRVRTATPEPALPRDPNASAGPAQAATGAPSPAPVPVEGAIAPGSRGSAPVVSAPAPATAPAHAERPARASPGVTSPAVPSSPAAPTAASSAPASLGDELDAIRKARANVLAGHGKEALDGLDAYGRAHPAGSFQEEALALRVRAFRLLGDGDGAARALGELEARFPNSVHLAALHAGPPGR